MILNEITRQNAIKTLLQNRCFLKIDFRVSDMAILRDFRIYQICLYFHKILHKWRVLAKIHIFISVSICTIFHKSFTIISQK